ncbi:hypothetical protein [Bacillus sp. EB01]|uniref:hypothetical protein n=1 Tax=Bacillus sp. EB01 TaxID=1347086 RepID=UPI0005C73474|nr:hypothetical protein [Bacillus sp. EB01]
MQTESEHMLISAIFENKEYFTRIARRFLLTEEDVEDALQKMIYKAFKSIKNLNEPNHLAVG